MNLNQPFWVPLLLVAGLSLAQSAGATDFGINYAVTATDTTLTPNCDKDSNANVHQKFVLPRYEQPTEKTAREQLKGIHDAGFHTIRSIVQLYPGAHPSGDLVNTGKIDDSVLDPIKQYVGDVRDAGFKAFILAFGTQGTANAACKKNEWGDCFDPSTIPASVAAEAKIIAAVRSVKGISLRVDLLNEACVSAAVPKIANDNFAQYIRAAAKMHATSFPDVPATVSCQLERTPDGLATVARLFAENGDHVGFFDIHAYPQSNHKEPEMLQRAAASLQNDKTPIIVGETTYGDLQYRQFITDGYRAAFHHDPPELLFWPLHSVATHCNFDVPQPYTLKSALGKE